MMMIFLIYTGLLLKYVTFPESEVVSSIIATITLQVTLMAYLKLKASLNMVRNNCITLTVIFVCVTYMQKSFQQTCQPRTLPSIFVPSENEIPFAVPFSTNLKYLIACTFIFQTQPNFGFRFK